MDGSEDGMDSGNNSDNGVHEGGRAHSNTWDFEEGKYLVCAFGRKVAHDMSETCRQHAECGLLFQPIDPLSGKI